MGSPVTKERNILPDVIKGIAIILVILGHSIQYGSGKEFIADKEFFNNVIYRIIYSFHMPLFMLISGYFFAITVRNKSTRELLFSRFSRLLVPVFAWNGLFFLFHFLYNIKSVNAKDEILNYLDSTFYTLWFIWAIFWCSLIVLLVNKFFNDRIYIYCIIFILLFIVPDLINIALYKFMYPFFVFGYFFNNYKEKIINTLAKVRDIYLIYGLTLLYVILMLFYRRDSFIYTSGFSIIGNDPLIQVSIDIYRLFVGLIGSSVVILFIRYLLRKKSFFMNAGILSRLGIESLGIYIFSGYLFLILERITENHSINYGYALLETFVILLISYMATLVLKKFTLSNVLLLGGR